jgi:hypothetical protein
VAYDCYCFTIGKMHDFCPLFEDMVFQGQRSAVVARLDGVSDHKK